jgi:putative heme-binding domain-containing protein
MEGSLDAETRQAIISKGIKALDRPVADLFESFIPEQQRVKTLGSEINPQAILALPGDARRGRKIFFQPGGALCNTCHRLGDEGREFGPDLSQIGTKYTRAQLLENILEPSKVIDPRFVAYSLEGTDGELHTGFLVKQDSTEAVLRGASGSEMKVPAKKIAKLEPQKLSIMPDGLFQHLTAQEAADLLEFLAELR